MIILFFTIPIIFLISDLIAAYFTLKKIKQPNNQGRRLFNNKLKNRFTRNIRAYKDMEDFYVTRDNIKYP